MLPFTKRPGRENENDEVLTKDIAVPPRSVPPPARAAQPSFSDDEMTNIMPSKALGDVEAQLEKYASPRPAAGAPPPSSARSAPASIPPPRHSQRPPKYAADADEEEGRTVVRGAPKIVKRTNPKQTGGQLGGIPTTVSPAAVIKASLESASAGRTNKRTGEHLMAPPPADLLEDLNDLAAPPKPPADDVHPADVGAEHTAILQSTGTNHTLASQGVIQGVQPIAPASSQQILAGHGLPSGSIPPGSSRPMSAPPPPMAPPSSQVYNPAASGGYAAQSGGYAAQSGGYAAQSGGYPAGYAASVPSASVSVPGMATSMPAHFMVPQAPYSDARVDPPATAVTARTKVKGRAPMSWAVALLMFGVFVGVGWVAVQRGGAGGLATTASFVDPAKAGAPKAAAAPANPDTATTPTPTPVAVATEQPATVSAPPVAVPVTPPPAETAAAAPPPAATTEPAPPPTAAAVAAAPPPTAAAATVAAAPAAAPAPTTKTFTSRPVHTAAAPVAAAPAPVARPRPAPVAAAEEPAAAPEKPAKGGKGAKPAGKGGGEVDEETKKALEALQKSQLESSF